MRDVDETWLESEVGEFSGSRDVTYLEVETAYTGDSSSIAVTDAIPSGRGRGIPRRTGRSDSSMSTHPDRAAWSTCPVRHGRGDRIRHNDYA